MTDFDVFATTEEAYREGYRDGYAEGEDDAAWRHESEEEDAFDEGKEEGARLFVEALDTEKLTTVLIQNWKNWHTNQSYGLQRMLAGEIKTYLEGLTR